MSSTTSMESAEAVLEKYQKHPFAKGLLPFRAALKSLDTPWPVIRAEDAGRQRWVICDVKTKRPAIFSHAALIAETDDIETGNYVPHGQEVPVGVEAKSVQRRPNGKCFYTYKFDSSTDLSLYEGQWILDDYMRGLDGFNSGNLPRRPYLSGQEARYRTKFWMQTPVFLKRGAKDGRVAPPKHLHDWVLEGDRSSKDFRANPDRPRVWVKEGNHTVPIADSTCTALRRGDVVGVAFLTTYHITGANWFPQFHPVDLVVFKRADVDATDYSAPALDLYSQPPPAFCDQPGDGSSPVDPEYQAGVVSAFPQIIGEDAKDPAKMEVEGTVEPRDETTMKAVGTQEAMDVDGNRGAEDSQMHVGDADIEDFDIIQHGDDGHGQAAGGLGEVVASRDDDKRGRPGRGSRRRS